MTTIEDSLKGKAQAAFNRSVAHPADPRVRIVNEADDLVAIHCEGVSAVIWQREAPEEVVQALDEIDVSKISGHGAFSPDFQGLREGGEGTSEMGGRLMQRDFPAAICLEMKKLSDLFMRVSGRTEQKVSELINYQHFTDMNTTFTQTYLPHVDGFILRLGCVFSKEAEMGTQWHPGCTKPDVAFDRKPRTAEEVDEIKKSLGVEQIDTAHVVIFKGHHRQIYTEAEYFAHSTKLPKKDVLRVGYFVGYF